MAQVLGLFPSRIDAVQGRQIQTGISNILQVRAESD